MGFAKREMERQEACAGAATEIAVRTDTLHRCEFCEEVTDNYRDRVEAYKFGNWLMSQGDELVGPFNGDRKEMTDAIDSVIDGAPMKCHCRGLLDRDD